MNVWEIIIDATVAGAAITSAIYAGYSSETARKALHRKNHELLEQNKILKETQGLLGLELSLKHAPLFQVQNWNVAEGRVTLNIKNIGGFSSIPKLYSGHSLYPGAKALLNFYSSEHDQISNGAMLTFEFTDLGDEGIACAMLYRHPFIPMAYLQQLNVRPARREYALEKRIDIDLNAATKYEGFK